MNRLAAILLSLALLPGAAWAQAVESVIVTAPRDAPNQVIQNFIRAYAAPTALIGKLTRWQTGICPVAVGLRPEAIRLILKHLKDNAAQAGAPGDAGADCAPNIEIVFTTTPQVLLDNIRRKNPGYLGYSRRRAQTDRLAIVTHPIQAWYTTASRDANGKRRMDSALTVGLGDIQTLASATLMPVTGFRTRDGLSSELYHVIIVITPDRLAEYEIGSLADYISMLALSQMASLDDCQPLASIINLLVPGCAAVATAISESDRAFLRGLYRMPRDYSLAVQKAGISEAMKRDFQGE